MTTATRIGIVFLAAAGVAALSLPAQAKKKPSDIPIAHEIAPANPVPWSALEGKNKVTPGLEDGVYLWHVGDTVHIMTTSTSKKGIVFGGSLKVTGGAISNVKSVKEEQNDIWKLYSPQHLNFKFETHQGTDGLTFHLEGGAKLSLLALEEGTGVAPLYIGPKEMGVVKLPLTVDLTK